MTRPYRQMIHAPNGMQLTELNETPKMECNKRNLVSDRGMKIPTLTLAPMGMVAPWRCQELQIYGRLRSAFAHWAIESITSKNQHKTLDSILLTEN